MTERQEQLIKHIIAVAAVGAPVAIGIQYVPKEAARETISTTPSPWVPVLLLSVLLLAAAWAVKGGFPRP